MRLFVPAQLRIGNDLVFCDRDHFARADVPEKFCADSPERTVFRGDHIGGSFFPQAERLDAKGIPDGGQLPGAGDDQGVGAPDQTGGIQDGRLHGFCMDTFSGDAVCDHLGVRIGVEDGAVLFQVLPERAGIDQIAVVRQGEGALYVIHDQRLGVFQLRRSGGGVADMSDPEIAGQLFQILFAEDFIYKPHAPAAVDIALRPFCVADCDAAGFLAAVLQGVEPHINGMCRRSAFQIIDAEDAAGFF